MVLFPRGLNKGDRSLDERWQEIGREAKENTMSLDEWGDIDIARWDLDEPEREPTGVENRRTWTYDPPVRETNTPGARNERPDVRDQPDR